MEKEEKQYVEWVDSIGGIDAVERFYNSLKALVRYRSGKALQSYLIKNIVDIRKLKLLAGAALIGLRCIKAGYSLEQGTEIIIDEEDAEEDF
jgi:hypothetical protein